jgi:ubiquinone/menaquinone biosynthesis C-methylase UbiE
MTNKIKLVNLSKMQEHANLNYWNSVGQQKKFKNPNLVLINEAQFPRDRKILDVGCGYGRSLLGLQQNGYQNLYGIDYSSEMIQRAKNETGLPTAHLVCGSALSLPFEDEFFDVILLFATLNCLPGRDAIALKEAMRVLRPGGHILINDFIASGNLMNSDFYREDEYGPFAEFLVDGACNMRHTSVERAKTMNMGMKLISFETQQESSMNGNPVEIASYILLREP